MMTDEQMDQFECDMLSEYADIILENLRQSIIDEKLNELIQHYDLDAKYEQSFC